MRAKKKAFTLIELMIVVAILGICFTGIFPQIRELFGQHRHEARIVEENKSLMHAYLALKKALRDPALIAKTDSSTIVLDNDSVIRVIDDGRILEAAGKTVKLAGNARISDFMLVDSKSFSTEVFTGVEKLRVIWRTGE